MLKGFFKGIIRAFKFFLKMLVVISILSVVLIIIPYLMINYSESLEGTKYYFYSGLSFYIYLISIIGTILYGMWSQFKYKEDESDILKIRIKNLKENKDNIDKVEKELERLGYYKRG